ncbi:hypothetical protein ABPG75_009913 [Micractinium tetrahymenae]
MHLMRVRELPSSANEGFLGVSLGDLVRGPMKWVLVSNYMVDLPWLLSGCPDLRRAGRVVLVHGEQFGSEEMAGLSKAAAEYRRRRTAEEGPGPERLILHAPPLPLEYGTHHSKAFFIAYDTGMRVVILTANAIYADNNNKTQGLFFQDFPLKDGQSPQTSSFEQGLAAYVAVLRLPPAVAREALQLVARHDFSAARGHLVASVPGRHTGAALHAWGHMRVRAALQAEPPWPPAFAGAPLACQFSSMGGFSSDWLTQEFRASLSAGHCSNGGTLGLPASGPAGMQLVWTAAGEVRQSLEGWGGGRSIPGRSAHVNQAFMQPFYRRWGGEACGRQRALPHIKAYVRYRAPPGGTGDEAVELAWAYVGSANLSRAAWGGLEKQGSQLCIRSYELGVLMTPSTEAAYRGSRWAGFSCTSPPRCQGATAATKGNSGTAAASAASAAEVHAGWPAAGPSAVCLTQWRAGTPQAAAAGPAAGQLRVPLPIPYRLPPQPYAAGEQPWASDADWLGEDSLGITWDQGYLFLPHYGHLQPAD